MSSNSLHLYRIRLHNVIIYLAVCILDSVIKKDGNLSIQKRHMFAWFSWEFVKCQNKEKLSLKLIIPFSSMYNSKQLSERRVLRLYLSLQWKDCIPENLVSLIALQLSTRTLLKKKQAIERLVVDASEKQRMPYFQNHCKRKTKFVEALRIK